MLALLLIGATVGISVDEVRDVDASVTDRIVETLSARIQEHSGLTVVLDTMLWNSCTRDDRCVEDVRSRTKTRDVAFVQIFGGVRRVRVSVDHVDPDGNHRSARATLPLDRDFGPALQKVVEQTFSPGVAPPPDVPLVVTPPPPEPRARWPIWLTAGLTVAAAGTAIGFGVSAQGATSQLDGRITRPTEYDALETRADQHGMVSNAAWIAAGVAAAATLTLVAFDLLDDE